MTRKDKELAQTLRDLDRRERRDSGPHVAGAELGALLEGRLGVEDKARATEHLLACSECARLFQELVRFSQSDAEAQRTLAVADVDGAWQALRNRLPEQSPASPRPVAPGLRRGTLATRGFQALAASLLAAALGLGAWNLTLRREIVSLRQESERRDQPWLNVPVVDLEPRRDSSRGGSDADRVEVTAAGAEGLTLILHALDERRFADYELEIAAGDGELLWRGEGLKKAHGRYFTVSLPRRLLAAGSYRLRIHGTGEDGRELVEEYQLRIRDE